MGLTWYHSAIALYSHGERTQDKQSIKLYRYRNIDTDLPIPYFQYPSIASVTGKVYKWYIIYDSRTCSSSYSPISIP